MGMYATLATRAESAIKKEMRELGKKLLKAAQAEVSLKDHTLKDLKD